MRPAWLVVGGWAFTPLKETAPFDGSDNSAPYNSSQFWEQCDREYGTGLAFSSHDFFWRPLPFNCQNGPTHIVPIRLSYTAAFGCLLSSLLFLPDTLAIFMKIPSHCLRNLSLNSSRCPRSDRQQIFSARRPRAPANASWAQFATALS